MHFLTCIENFTPSFRSSTQVSLSILQWKYSGCIWIKILKLSLLFGMFMRTLSVTHMAQPVFLLGSLAFGNLCENETGRYRFILLWPTLWFLCLVQGLKDLVWLPIEQYRKDGRIVRGFQRGAASFGTSTAMAALELTNRMVQTIQVLFPARLIQTDEPCIAATAHS